MKIIEYTENWKDKWDRFVLNSNNGTIFHLQRFFEYHSPKKFAFNHLIFVEKNEIVAVLPGNLIDGLFESPIGASYGSIVTRDIKFEEAMKIVSALLDYGKANGIKRFLLTAAPMIYEKYQNQNLDFASWGFPATLVFVNTEIDARTLKNKVKC